MITKFVFSNFYSFAEETEVSFEIGKQPSSSLYDVELSDGRRLNKVIAVVGANGSGKTQLLRPLAFINLFVLGSFFSIGNIAFKTHAFYENKDTSIELFFHINGIDYKYKLSLNKNYVLHESLHKKTSKQYSYVFIRERKESGDYFFKQKNFGFPKKSAEILRNNVSLISASRAYGIISITDVINFFTEFEFNINSYSREYYDELQLVESAKYFTKNEIIKLKMKSLLCELDLGLSSIEFEEFEVKNENGESQKEYMPIGFHAINESKFSLPFLEESSGTQSAFVLLRRILPVLENGGVAIIDEIDNGIHYSQLEKLWEKCAVPKFH